MFIASDRVSNVRNVNEENVCKEQLKLGCRGGASGARFWLNDRTLRNVYRMSEFSERERERTCVNFKIKARKCRCD